MFQKIFFIVQLIIICILVGCESLNILAVMPHVGKSHQLVFEPLFKKLASNGHNMTLITRYPVKHPVPNWRDVSLAPDGLDTEYITFDLLTGTRIDRYACVGILAYAAHAACKDGLSHPNYQSFLKEDNHFDLILIEVFNTPCFMGVVKRYNAPIIGLASSIWMPWMYQFFGTPSNPSYVPNHFLGHTDHMSFMARVENTLMYLFNNFVYDIFMDYLGNQASKEYTGVDLYEEGDVMKNISILLLNTHFSFSLKAPLSPNVIEIGGIHVESRTAEPLPQDLENFVKESNHGIIYMSLGSTIRGDSLPESKKQAFLNAFSRLPLRVIWKWEGEMENKPSNVMTSRWAPQMDILCHPNVKVFISHSGLLGSTEALHCGKPILLLPLFGDQFTNAAALEQNGGGLVLNWNDISEDIVYETLLKLLSPEFTTSSKELSNRFKDRPISPMNTALYWIDYVARYKGAQFMKLASVDLPWYQYFLVDVTLFLIVIIIMYLYLSCLIVKFIFKICKKHDKIKKS